MYKIQIAYEDWTPKKGTFLRKIVKPTIYASRQEAVDALRKEYPGEIYFPGGVNLFEGGLLSKSGERRHWRIFKTRSVNQNPTV